MKNATKAPLQEDAVQPDVAQRRASDPDKSVWVSASAGSGKTKVLADRVVRLLLSGVAPQRILCLTFTRAAAAEMSIRVTRQLAHWATCPEETLVDEIHRLEADGSPPSAHLERARRLFAKVLECPGGLRIRTIHSFAQEILRRFPLEAGISPHFAVLEEAETQALWRGAQHDLLQRVALEPDSEEGRAFHLLARDMGEESFDSVLSEIVRDQQRLKAAVARAGGLKELFVSMRRFLLLESEDTEERLLSAALDDLAWQKEDLKRAAAWLLEGSKTDSDKGKSLSSFLSLALKERLGCFDDYRGVFLTQANVPFKRSVTKKVAESHPEILEILEREALRLASVCERVAALKIAEQTEAVLILAVALSKAFATRKAGQAALDYDDLICKTNALLEKAGSAAWVLYKLDGGIDHILVDEAQDTSPEQWRIIDVLASEFFAGLGAQERSRTLFVVGDEKQSIYSFLKADPKEFERMRAYFKNKIKALGDVYREVPLNVSFRSAPAILKAVDAIFADESARHGVSHEAVRHFSYRREAVGRVEVWPCLGTEEPEEDLEKWALPVGFEPEKNSAADLAEQIAKQIKIWLCEGNVIYDRRTKQERLLTPGDVMVLVRRRGKFVDLLVRKLKELQVPVTGVDRMKLTEQLAVKDLLALLQFTLLPGDDLNLATVLRGPLLGCSEEQLMALAIGRKGSLWQSVCESALAKECGYLRTRLALADKITPFAMLARVLNEPCPADEVSGRRAFAARLGPDAQDPIDELLNAAQDFGMRHAPSLQAFLCWLLAAESEIKRELDQGGGGVRITTVHAAKGLEAPVVFLPDCVGVPRKQELPKLLWEEKQNIPLYFSREPSNAAALRVYEDAREKQLEEYRRLLYVACTRAADRLYVCGWETSKREREENCWYNLIYGALEKHHDPTIPLLGKGVVPEIVMADPSFSVSIKTATPLQERAVNLPAWAHRPAVGEADGLRPLAPSKEAGAVGSPQDEARFARGRIIHRLLQNLPNRESSQWEDVARRYLAYPQHNLRVEQQEEISQEVLGILRHPDSANLFTHQSRAEVPIIGRVGDRMVSGQVDRLCLQDRAVWIVDYKTNRPPPASVSEVPLIYRRQMAAYCAVLHEIYPKKEIRCFLLWTYGPRLMELPEEALPSL